MLIYLTTFVPPILMATYVVVRANDVDAFPILSVFLFSGIPFFGSAPNSPMKL